MNYRKPVSICGRIGKCDSEGVNNMMGKKFSKYGIAVLLVALMGLVTACGKKGCSRCD